MTVWNVGIGDAFGPVWVRAWVMGFLISLPVAGLIIPVVMGWQARVSR